MSNMTTEEFWEYCDRLRSTRSGNKKRDIIAEMMKNEEPEDVEYALRLMLGTPFDDPEMSMGVGKKTVRKALTQIYNASYDEVREHEKEIGNLSEVPNELSRPNSLTVQERGVLLKTLVESLPSIAGSNTDNVQRVADLINDTEDPHVAVFALLSPKKDVSLGIGWKKVRDASVTGFGISKEDFERVRGLGHYTAKLGRKVSEGEFEDISQNLRPLDRIRPMLASSVSLPVDDSEWVGQTKYDGGRLVIHHVAQYPDPKIRAYTRQRHEISDNLPELEEIHWSDSSFIVDAEAVGYDPETGEPLPFQKFMERFQREKNVAEKAKEVEIGFRVFDCLYWSGVDLTQYGYQKRMSHLYESDFPDELIATEYDDLDMAYEEALDAGHEGIIAKKKNHRYEFDRSRSWRKLKPVKEPVELEVVGVAPGTGRRAGTLGALKLATGDGTHVGRVGTGFTDEKLDELWEMHQNDELIGSIVEIEYEEFQQRGGKYGLRFPRFLRLRPKTDAELDTLSDLQSS